MNVRRTLSIGAIAAFAMVAASCGSGGTATSTAESPTAPPSGNLVILQPQDGAIVATETITVSGTAPEGTRIVRDISLAPDDETTATGGTWAIPVKLSEGSNVLVFRVGDDKTTTVRLTVTYDPNASPAAIESPAPPTSTVTLEPTPAPSSTVTPEPTPAPTATPAPTPAPTATPKPLTAAQRNAIGTAQDYLDYTAFSRSGLIGQLRYEGYSKKVATFAVDSLDVNWKHQAYLMAQDYLDYSSFSLSGLISQLRYEGFTKAQAKYGATKAYNE